jgi:hypothetical protein
VLARMISNTACLSSSESHTRHVSSTTFSCLTYCQLDEVLVLASVKEMAPAEAGRSVRYPQAGLNGSF